MSNTQILPRSPDLDRSLNFVEGGDAEEPFRIPVLTYWHSGPHTTRTPRACSRSCPSRSCHIKTSTRTPAQKPSLHLATPRHLPARLDLVDGGDAEKEHRLLHGDGHALV